MTAFRTLSQPNPLRKSPIGKTGVLTLAGFGLRVCVQSAHLEIEDGVGTKRRKMRLPRIGHGLRRLVVIGSDGFISLAALEWLSSQDASFVMLERNGKVLCVTGPAKPSEAKLRRAQALAAVNGLGLEIARTLIDAKLTAQANVSRERLNCGIEADVIESFRKRLTLADSFETIRNIEANAASFYFRAWRTIPVIWPKADLPRIPDHWLFAGSRQSPLSGGPRLAVTPVHAILNYCFALLEAEARLAVSALGLDPGLGVGLHTDTANRDSLALDVLEPVRPSVEAWVLNWIRSEPLRRSDFFETDSGNCRLRCRLCSQLSETAPTWAKLVAPWAEYVARALSHTTGRARTPATRLTQQHRREAKGSPPLPPETPTPRRENICRGCGKAIRAGRSHCAHCAVEGAAERFADVARLGRAAARSPEACAKHSATRKRHAQACSGWDASSQPPWLTAEVYFQKIQPKLVATSTSTIASRIGVSRWYAGRIRKGYRPHPRHWRVLAELVGH